MPGINHFFIKENDVPYKFQPGSVNYELAYGIQGIGDYFTRFAEVHGGEGKDGSLREAAAFTYRVFAAHEEKLSSHLLDFLNSRSSLRIIGKKEAGRDVRMPTISFVVNNTKSSTITQEVDKYKIGIRFGDFYARRLIENLGLMSLDGVVRVSMLHYNTIDEVDRLIRVFDTLF